MTTVFVTGATGFIGRAVTRELLRTLNTEDRLLMLVRKPVEYADKRILTVIGDLRELDKVAAFVSQADFVIHIAGEARMYSGNDYGSSNVTATQQLVDIASGSGSLQRFIFISSMTVMDRLAFDRCDGPLTIASPCAPRSDYGKSKLQAEGLLLGSSLPHTIFRPGFVYGPGMNDESHLRKFARLISKGVPLHRFDFPGRISLVHVDDLAAAVVKCLQGDTGLNRTYLAETENMPLGEALALLGESLFGKKPLQFPVPAMKFILQRLHSRLPVASAALFLDYYRMDDPCFRKELIAANRQRTLADHVRDITQDLP